MTVSISVVTPSFNHAEFIAATLDSVLDQGYPNLEHIVIDGGSSDATPSILECYRDRLAYVVSEPDGGQTDALRKGFARATGDILAWLNSDDLYGPNTLREVADWFEGHPEAEFVYGDALWIDRRGTPIRSKREIPYNRFIWLNDYNYIPQPSAFWRRSLYERVGGMDTAFDLAMDGDLFDRFAQVTTPHHVRRCWSSMRFYPEQKNQAFRERSNAEDDIIRARHDLPVSGYRRRFFRVAAKACRVATKLRFNCYEIPWRGGGMDRHR